ncbi:MAG: hypothetical protein LUD46_13125 [Parabacteroides sp.]|nr:hypothetical protein [Parabacteroides sp.]
MDGRLGHSSWQALGKKLHGFQWKSVSLFLQNNADLDRFEISSSERSECPSPYKYYNMFFNKTMKQLHSISKNILIFGTPSAFGW